MADFEGQQLNASEKCCFVTNSGDTTISEARQTNVLEPYITASQLSENASVMSGTELVQNDGPKTTHGENKSTTEITTTNKSAKTLKLSPIHMPSDVKGDPSISPENPGKRRRVQHNYRRLSSSGYVDDYERRDRFCATSESDTSLTTPPKIKLNMKVSPSKLKPDGPSTVIGSSASSDIEPEKRGRLSVDMFITEEDVTDMSACMPTNEGSESKDRGQHKTNSDPLTKTSDKKQNSKLTKTKKPEAKSVHKSLPLSAEAVKQSAKFDKRPLKDCKFAKDIPEATDMGPGLSLIEDIKNSNEQQPKYPDKKVTSIRSKSDLPKPQEKDSSLPGTPVTPGNKFKLKFKTESSKISKTTITNDDSIRVGPSGDKERIHSHSRSSEHGRSPSTGGKSSSGHRDSRSKSHNSSSSTSSKNHHRSDSKHHKTSSSEKSHRSHSSSSRHRKPETSSQNSLSIKSSAEAKVESEKTPAASKPENGLNVIADAKGSSDLSHMEHSYNKNPSSEPHSRHSSSHSSSHRKDSKSSSSHHKHHKHHKDRDRDRDRHHSHHHSSSSKHRSGDHTRSSSSKDATSKSVASKNKSSELIRKDGTQVNSKDKTVVSTSPCSVQLETPSLKSNDSSSPPLVLRIKTDRKEGTVKVVPSDAEKQPASVADKYKTTKKKKVPTATLR